MEAGTLEGKFDNYVSLEIKRFNLGEDNGSIIYDYENNRVLIDLGTGLINSARNAEELALYQELVNLEDPNEEQQTLIDLIIDTPILDTSAAYLLGDMMVATSLLSSHVVQTTYDPLRPFLANPCAIKNCHSDAWASVTGLGASFRGNTHNFTSYGASVALGLQAPLTSKLVVGGGLFYEYDNLEGNDHGSVDSNALLGTVYALYRPQSFYLFGNLNGGYNFHDSVRVDGDRYNSNPGVGLVNLYAEAGKDFCLNHWLLQPFFGVNVGYNNWGSFNENNDGLNVAGKSYADVASRVGLHLYYQKDGILLGIDGAWDYRLTSDHYYRVSSQDSINLARSSFDGALYAKKQITNRFQVYGEGGLKIWSQAVEGRLLAGISYSL